MMGHLNYISSYKDVKRNDGFGGIVLDDFTIDDFTTLDLVFQWRPYSPRPVAFRTIRMNENRRPNK